MYLVHGCVRTKSAFNFLLRFSWFHVIKLWLTDIAIHWDVKLADLCLLSSLTKISSSWENGGHNIIEATALVIYLNLVWPSDIM